MDRASMFFPFLILSLLAWGLVWWVLQRRKQPTWSTLYWKSVVVSICFALVFTIVAVRTGLDKFGLISP